MFLLKEININGNYLSKTNIDGIFMTRVITLISGKGGVGKTTSSINLSQSLFNAGKSVILVDANLSTPNVALHLGHLKINSTLNHFLQKRSDLRGIIYQSECGFSLIPASSSYDDYIKTNVLNIGKLIEKLEGLADFIIIDAPSGLGNDFVSILKYTDEAIAVVNPTTSSVLEALKSIEVAKQKNNVVPGAILNMTTMFGRHELKEKEIKDILGVQILANIRLDKKIKRSLFHKMPLNYLYSSSRSAKQYDKVVNYLLMDSKD